MTTIRLQTALAAGMFVLLSSCRSYEIVSPATIATSPEWVRVQAGEKSLNLDLTPIKNALSHSTWCSDTFLDKGAYHLEIKDGPDVFVSIYGAYFWIEGQRGYYKVSECEREGFQRFFSNLKDKEPIKWQLNHR